MLLGLVVDTVVGFVLGNDVDFNVGDIDGDTLVGLIVVG
jgi:hypothetical protein